MVDRGLAEMLEAALSWQKTRLSVLYYLVRIAPSQDFSLRAHVVI